MVRTVVERYYILADGYDDYQATKSIQYFSICLTTLILR